MGLVGGGQGGFIGRIHALAATFDNCADLVAGAFSSDPVKSRAAAPVYGIEPERAYGTYQEMIDRESLLPLGERIDFISIATPNDTHYAIARACAEASFNVVCDKPLTTTLRQAEELAGVVARTGIVFALMHNYTGYPMVRQARQLVRTGELGDVFAVRVHYLQGSLRRQRTPEQQKRFAWKNDPSRAGPSGCFGDIGIHAYHLARFITGLVPERIACTLETFHPEGRLDDYGTAVIQFQNGALGTLTASRISHGRENGLRIEIDGTKGSMEWHQEEPNRLLHRVNGEPQRLYTRDPNSPYLLADARTACRLPAGHPEGFLQAFANIYASAYPDMIDRLLGRKRDETQRLYPTVADGVDGVWFVSQCLASSRKGALWV